MHALINRSKQSLGRSAMSIEELVNFGKQHQLKTMALTDVQSLNGLPEFIGRCKDAGIQPVAGITIQIHDAGLPFGELVLLAKGDVGYAALRRAELFAGFVGDDSEYTPTRGWKLSDVLDGKYAFLFKHCVALDGFDNSIGQQLLSRAAGGPVKAMDAEKLLLDSESDISRLRDQFTDGDYVAVDEPGLESPLAQALVLMAAKDQRPYPVVETPVAHAINPEQMAYTKQRFLNYAKDALAGVPGGLEGRINALNRRFNHRRLDTLLKDGVVKPLHPDYITSEAIADKCPTPNIHSDRPYSALLRGGPDVPELSELVETKWAAFKTTLPADQVEKYEARLRSEMSTIHQLNYAPYFLNIYKLQQASENSGNESMLRGSGVSSLVLHVMGCSPIDPIKEGLLFKRFLDEERGEEPDVDMEFVYHKGMIRTITNVFEGSQVAMLSNEGGTSKPELLLREAYDTLMNFSGLSAEQKAELTKQFTAMVQPLEGKTNKVATQWPAWLQEEKPKFTTLYQRKMTGYAERLGAASMNSQGSPASAVLVPEGVIKKFNLYQTDKKGNSPAQRITHTKHTLAPTGEIKYDILSNYSFTRTQLALRNIGLGRNFEVSPSSPTIEYAFRRKSYMGLSQLSGVVAPMLLGRFTPKTFDDLVAINAIIRDGSDDANLAVISQYQFNRDNPDQASKKVPALFWPVLQETSGVLLYEEQLMRMLNDVAGFTWKEADKFRSRLKKSDPKVVADYEGPFIEKMMSKHGVSEAEASALYQPFREKNGRFVFSKAHASAYAHVQVKQCWIKCHYPAEYAAEMVLDKVGESIWPGRDERNSKKITLEMAVGDWRALQNGRKPKQDAVALVDALVKVIKREEKNMDSTYTRNPSNTKSDIIAAVNAGWLDFALPEGGREQVIAYAEREFDKLALDYAPVVPPRQASSAAKNRARKNKKGAPSGTELSVRRVGDVPAANKRKGFIDFRKKVMVGHMLDFLRQTGYVSQLEVTPCGATHDDYRFLLKKADGNHESVHIQAPSTEPARAAQVNPDLYGISSGMFQGSSMKGAKAGISDSAWLASELFSRGGYTDIAPMKSGKDYRAFTKQLSHFARSVASTVELQDIESGGIENAFIPCDVTPPIFSNVSKAVEDEGNKKMWRQLQKGRHVNLKAAQAQLDNGHLTSGEHWSYFTPKKTKVREIRRAVGAFANYRPIEPGKPLWENDALHTGNLSLGGHQVFTTKKNDDGSWKTSKIDYGRSTKGVKGNLCGHVEAGRQALWLTEAAIDTFSFNQLQGEIGRLNQRAGKDVLPELEQNSVSIRYAGGAMDFMTTLLDIDIDTNKQTGGVDFCRVNRTTARQAFSEDEAECLSVWMEHNTLHWVMDGSEASREGYERLEAFVESTGLHPSDSIRVHRCVGQETLRDVYARVAEAYPKDGNHVLCEKNIDVWLNGSRLAIEREDDKWAVGVMRTETKRGRMFSELSPQEQQAVAAHLVKQFRDMTGAASLGFALDNDGGGAIERQVRDVCDLIGLPWQRLMPKPIEGHAYKIGSEERTCELKDHNDYLTLYSEYREAKQYSNADAVLKQYMRSYEPPKTTLDIPNPDPTITRKAG
jgi:DNA polymerase III alpha subunit